MLEGFLLEKYYLDCISKDYDVFIGYSSNLKWGNFNFNFSNTLYKPYRQPVRQGKSIKKTQHPEISENILTWKNSNVKVNASWEGNAEHITDKLIDNENGWIKWECIQPKARADIKIGSDFNIKGYGYTEIIKMSMKPWLMGIDLLLWGRYHSEEHSIIWIFWEGANPLVRIFHNGNVYDKAKFSGNTIIFDDYMLKINDIALLRKGYVVAGLLRRIPIFNSLIPDSIKKLNEEKYIAFGELHHKNEKIYGKIIHEVITW